MKIILQDIQLLLLKDLSKRLLFSAFTLIIALIIWNYYGNLHDLMYTKYFGSITMLAIQFIVYACVFAGVYLLQSVFTNNFSYWGNKQFLLIVITAPLVFATQQYLYQHKVVISKLGYINDTNSITTTVEWLLRSCILIGYSTYIVHQFKINHTSTFRISTKVYLQMLLCMLPIICMAASTTAFQQTYPKLKIALQSNNPSIIKGLVLELSYLINFVAVEYFFRGILIIYLQKITGKTCILAMALFYCTIHFNKPMAECISSIAGGLLLGIMVYRSQSIKGGIIIHVGIALVMELAGCYFYFN